MKLFLSTIFGLFLCFSSAAQQQQWNRFVTTLDGVQLNGNVLTNVVASSVTNANGGVLTSNLTVNGTSSFANGVTFFGPVNANSGYEGDGSELFNLPANELVGVVSYGNLPTGVITNFYTSPMTNQSAGGIFANQFTGPLLGPVVGNVTGNVAGNVVGNSTYATNAAIAALATNAQTATTATLATNATTANNSIQSPYFKEWSYLSLANQLGLNTNHMMDGLWPSSGQVTIGCTNLFSSAGVFQPYMTNWWVMVAHAGGQDNITVATNYPFGSNTKTFNNWYDAIGMVTNVVNSQNVIINSTFGVTTNMVFIVAPTNNSMLQACYGFVCTNSGNNRLKLPEGILALSGPWLSTGHWTNSLTCLIYTPHIASSGPEKWVSVVGTVGPSLEINSSQGPMSEPNGILGTLIVPMVYGSNANLYSIFDTRDMTGPAIGSEGDALLPLPFAVSSTTFFPSASMPYSDATFDFENLNALCPYDCNFAVFNMLGAFKKVIKNCDIQASMVRDPRDAVGGTNGFGILNPGPFNDNKQVIDNVTICQFYNGMSMGGNNVCFNVSIFSAWNAIVTEGSANPDCFYGLNVQADKNYIQVWGQGYVKIYGMWPQDTGPVWSSYPNLAVANNGNFLFGSCDYDAESLLTYPTPLPTSPTLGTGSLSYLTVGGNNGAHGGNPTVPFVANEPVFLGPLTVYNTATVNGVTTINVTNSPFDIVLNNATGSGEGIISAKWYGNEGTRIGFDAVNANSALSPSGGYDTFDTSIQNGNLTEWSSWPDGTFHTWSNIVCGASSQFAGTGSGFSLTSFTNGMVGLVFKTGFSNTEPCEVFYSNGAAYFQASSPGTIIP